VRVRVGGELPAVVPGDDHLMTPKPVPARGLTGSMRGRGRVVHGRDAPP